MSGPSILVYGDAAVDIGLRIEDLPAAGLDTAASDPTVTAGGSAANCAATASRLGARVELVARLGSDLFARVITADLLSHGVGTSGIQVVEGPSALVIALIGPRGRRTLVSARGPASGRVPGAAYLPLLEEAALVHVSGYSLQDPGSRSTALELMREARRRGIGVSLDPSPLLAELSGADAGWLDGLDYFFPNLREAKALAGASTPEGAAVALRSLGAGTVVVTMGADGCLLNDGRKIRRIPAFGEFAVTDTTGAGDAFAGGFLAVTMAGGSTRLACRVGNFAAARVISQPGGHTATPGVGELRRFAERIGDGELQEAARLLEGASARRRGKGGGR